MAAQDTASGTLTETVNYALRASGSGSFGGWMAVAAYVGDVASTPVVAAGNVGMKFEATSSVGMWAESGEYQIWIDGTSPVLSGFVPLPSEWVSAAAMGNLTVTVSGGMWRGAQDESLERRMPEARR